MRPMRCMNDSHLRKPMSFDEYFLIPLLVLSGIYILYKCFLGMIGNSWVQLIALSDYVMPFITNNK